MSTAETLVLLQDKEIARLLERVEVLEKDNELKCLAIKKAIEAFNSLPSEALGIASSDNCFWPIRDELVAYLEIARDALADTPLDPR